MAAASDGLSPPSPACCAAFCGLRWLERQAEHDEYERKRNALIHDAVRHADAEAGPRPEEEEGDDRYQEWAIRWNREFSRQMETLVARSGIVRRG